MIIIVGLIAAFILIAVFSNRETRNCRWRADRRRDTGSTQFFRCAYCGAEAQTTTGKPPSDCASHSR